MLILEPNYGSCIVEEEIPLHWVEIPQYLQVVGNDREMQDVGGDGTTPAGTEEMITTSCPVEEELPSDYWTQPTPLW
jgi:hypothetical protein